MDLAAEPVELASDATPERLATDSVVRIIRAPLWLNGRYYDAAFNRPNLIEVAAEDEAEIFEDVPTESATAMYDPPTVVSITPANGATDVAIGEGFFAITVKFSTPMRPGTMDFVEPGPVYLIPTGDADVPVMETSMTWNEDVTEGTIHTTAPLQNAKGYKVIVGAGGGACQAVNGIPLDDSVEQADGFTTVAA